MKIDFIDRKILKELQANGKLQNNELAKKIGLSPSPCLRRVKNLEEQGVIDKYVAVINPIKVEKGLSVFARVWLIGQDAKTIDSFTSAMMKLDQVVECYFMAGDCDFLLRVVAKDIEDYRQFQIKMLSRLPQVQSVKTEIPMQKIKQTSEIPL